MAYLIVALAIFTLMFLILRVTSRPNKLYSNTTRSYNGYGREEQHKQY